MSWTLNCISDPGIVEVVFQGSVTGQAARQATSDAIGLAKAREIMDFLVDASGVEAAPDLSSLLDLPNKQYDAAGLSRLARIAIVSPRLSQARKDVQFYETACLNRGWNARLLSSRDEALRWLKEPRTVMKRLDE